jgi:hypothetical protein
MWYIVQFVLYFLICNLFLNKSYGISKDTPPATVALFAYGCIYVMTWTVSKLVDLIKLLFRPRRTELRSHDGRQGKLGTLPPKKLGRRL